MKGRMNFYMITACAFMLSICFSCKHYATEHHIPTDNEGKIHIYADQEYQSVVDEIIKSYENEFPDADVVVTYAQESDVMKYLLADSVRMVIIGRTLSAGEVSALTAAQGGARPKQLVFAYDGVAAVSSSAQADSIFDVDEFIASRQPGYNGKYKGYSFVFDNTKSGVVNTVLQFNGSADTSLQNIFALHNKAEVSEYVKKQPNSIGFISFAEVSDYDTPSVRQYLSGLKILQVTKIDSAGNKKTVPLSQGELALKEYPLERPVNCISNNPVERLGTGFANFLFKTKASRIILKAGLVPQTIPEREIQVNTE